MERLKPCPLTLLEHDMGIETNTALIETANQASEGQLSGHIKAQYPPSTTTDFLFARPSFLYAFSRLLDLGALLDVYNESPTPELADWFALRNDWRVVGEDLRAAYKTAIEQAIKEQLDKIESDDALREHIKLHFAR